MKIGLPQFIALFAVESTRYEASSNGIAQEQIICYLRTGPELAFRNMGARSPEGVP